MSGSNLPVASVGGIIWESPPPYQTDFVSGVYNVSFNGYEGEVILSENSYGNNLYSAGSYSYPKKDYAVYPVTEAPIVHGARLYWTAAGYYGSNFYGVPNNTTIAQLAEEQGLEAQQFAAETQDYWTWWMEEQEPKVTERLGNACSQRKVESAATMQSNEAFKASFK